MDSLSTSMVPMLDSSIGIPSPSLGNGTGQQGSRKWAGFGSGPARRLRSTKASSPWPYTLAIQVRHALGGLHFCGQLTHAADFFDEKHNIVLGGSWATHPRIAGRKSL